MSLPATTSQTVGPFFKIGLGWLEQHSLASEGAAGDRVTIFGRVLDGDGLPVPDAVLEIWHANSYGKYAHPEDLQDKPVDAGAVGFGRVLTNHDGTFHFASIKPGAVPGPNGDEQAPHLSISIFMRGLQRRLTTRMYFPDDARNSRDPILNLVDAARRPTLVAKTTSSADGVAILEWNVILQGAYETVFFDLGL